MNSSPQVLVVGAGPAGLAAAARLSLRGVRDVLLVDREPEAGGIPRFCRHPTFGLTDFHRPMSGPAYAARWRKNVDPAMIAASTTITRIDSNGEVVASTAEGGKTLLTPRRILLATGIRERPRSARLVSGDRPLNVLTTGALQRLIGEGLVLPFRRPVIVGTEMVSFSAALSLRDHGVRPVAMLEPGSQVVSVGPGKLFARFYLQTPVLCRHRLVAINATPADASRLQSVTVEANGVRQDIGCDAVIFTGDFLPEASLLASRPELLSPLSEGPIVDQHWRTADSTIFAAGNVLRSVETAAWSAREGAAAADAIAADLAGAAVGRRVPIELSGPIKLVVPGALTLPVTSLGPLHMQVRMTRSATGRFIFRADGVEVWRSSHLTMHRERRHALTRQLPDLTGVRALALDFAEDS